MKQATIILISLLFTISLLQADKKSDEQTVKQLVQKVKQSQGDERRKAMNALKVQLRSMNRAIHQKVMMDLQKSFAAKQHDGMQRGAQRHTTHKNLSSGGGHSISPARPPQISAPQTPPHTAPSISPNRPQMPSQRPGQQGGRR